jgi:anti-sigma factor RsiW
MTGHGKLDESQLLGWRHGTLPEAERQRLALLVEADAAAQELLREWDRQDAALKTLYGAIAEEPVPAPLREMLDRAAGEGLRRGRTAPVLRMHLPLRLVAALVLLGLGAAAGWSLARYTPGAVPGGWQAEAAIAAHNTFAVEVAHPVEVGADQSEHLTRWLSRRLGHPIDPPDFAAYGFSLMGGRILPAETGTAAVFMYENATGQRITLYAAPGAGEVETAFRFVQQGATQSFWWVDGTLRYAVVGDVPRDVLRGVAVAAWQQLV